MSARTDSLFSLIQSKYHGVCLSRTWIGNIVQQDTSVTPEQVYKKWLTTDILETEGSNPDIPDNILDIPKTDLTGPLTFQVNSVVNIGSSVYSQLRKLKGKEEAPQATQYSAEPPASRMLFLTLTDGTNVVNGMEYRQCSQLNLNLLPGGSQRGIRLQCSCNNNKIITIS